ncbi:Vesicle transport protein, partial [Perkinsus olseni]
MSTSTAQQSNSPDFASTLQFYSSSAPPATMSNQDKMVNLGKRAGQSIQTNAPVVLGAISSAIAGAMNTVKDAASGATGASTTAKTNDLDTFDLELGKVDTAGQTSSGSSSASNGQAGENASLISQWTSSAMQSGTQAFQGMKQQASDMASTRDTIGKFIMFFAAGCICMMLALTFLPMVVIAPQKFALMFTVGSCLILMSFSVLKGHAAFIAHIMSPEKRLFTAGYAASLVATLYGALVSKSYVLTVV